MKVRIARNSIRFRLKQAEVESFAQQHSITEKVEFGINPEDQLSFTLSVAEGEVFAVAYRENGVTVQVPREVAGGWTGTQMVGFEKVIDTGKGKTITVLVEKDFACLDAGEGENEGMYPNPKAAC